MGMTSDNKILLFGFALPLIIALICKIFAGTSGMIYGFAGTYSVEIVWWGFRHSDN